MTESFPAQAVAVIKKRLGNTIPKIGIVLGSGLGNFAEQIAEPIIFPYHELPGFPESRVAGHAGELVIGQIKNTTVACYSGRRHSYEGENAAYVKTMIRTLKLLGCEMVFITNAAGSLRAEMIPGTLMMITDHINLSFANPLAGMNDQEFGPRFMSMDEAYDAALRRQLLTAAKNLDIPLAQGVYIGVLGPSFETPAEIRAFRTLGADSVGMSTVPEVIIARHCSLRVVAVSVITNLAAGMSDEKLTHGGTLHYSAIAVEQLTKLIIHFIENLHHAN